MTIETAREAATRGAALLDQHKPGWAKDINTDILDLGDCTDCVLGQLYGSYGSVLLLGFLSSWKDKFTFGFSIPGSVTRADWGLLTDAWIEQIAERVVTPEHIEQLV